MVAPSKIVPPTSHSGLIRRTPKVECLREVSRESGLTGLSAPAGYGKTTLLAELANDDLRSCVWLGLEESECDEHQFLAALAAAVEVGTGATPEDTTSEALLAADSFGKLATVLGLARRLSHPPLERLLIIDDLHTVLESSGTLGLLRALLTSLPDYIDVLVASRSKLPARLIEVHGRPRYAHIGSDALRFDSDEIQSYLVQSEIPANQWHRIIWESEECEGWPAAVTLIIKSRQAGEFRRVAPGVDAQSMFASLASRMLTQLPGRYADFLMQTANLERLVPELCDVCLGKDDSEAMLRDLLSMNLFLEETKEAREYRLHGLFRKFLLENDKANSEFSPEQHARAAEWFHLRGDSVAEVRHCIRSGRHDHAAARIAEVAPALADAGRWYALLGVVRELECSEPTAMPVSLLRWRAVSENAIGDWKAAIQTASMGLAATDEEPEQARLLISRSYAHALRGELSFAMRDAGRALRMLGDSSSRERLDLMRVLGTAHAEALDLRQSLRFFEEAAGIADHGEADQSTVLTLCDLSTAEQMVGRLDSAASYARRAIRVADDLGFAIGMALGRNNLATSQHLMGRYDEAIALLQQGRPLAWERRLRHIESLMWLSEGDVRKDLLQYDAANTCYDRGRSVADRIDAPTMVAYSLRAKSALYRAAGDLAQSRECLAQSQQWIARGHKRDRALHLVASGALSIEEGNLVQAGKDLSEASDVFQQAGAEVDLARTRLEVAYWRFVESGIALAIPELERLRQTVERIHHKQFLIPEGTRMPRLWGAVRTAGRSDLYEDLMRPDLRPQTHPEARGLPASARFDDPLPALLSSREREIVIGLCDGLQRDEIAQRLGLSRSTIDKTISGIYASTGLTKAYQIVAWAIRCGLYDPYSPPPPQ